MPRQERKEISFQAGEVSPLLYGRSETEFYEKGLAIAKNVSIDKRGGAFRRVGLEHFGQVDGNNARVFTKQIDRYRFDTIIIRDLEMIVIAPGSGFLTPNLISNPSFVEGGTDWTVNVSPATSAVVFSGNAARLQPSTATPELVIEPSFNQDGAFWNTRLSAGASTVTFINGDCTITPRSGGPAGSEFAGIWQDITTLNPGTLHTMNLEGVLNTTLNVKIGTGEDEGSILDVDITDVTAPIDFTPPGANFTITLNVYNIQGNTDAVLGSVSIPGENIAVAGISQEATVTALQTAEHLVQVIQSGSEPFTINIGTTVNGSEIATLHGSNEIEELVFVPNNPTFWVTVEADGDETSEVVVTFVGAVAEAASSGIGLLMPAPWTEAQLGDIHIADEPNGEGSYFVHPNVPPQKLVYDFATDVYNSLEAVIFIAAPAVWTGTNWPATATHFQGRMWYAGTPNQPQTIWGSVSASPDDFTVTAGLESSSLEFTLQKFGRIQWLLGTKELLIGTENGEHILVSEGPVITATDFEIRQQSAYGSNGVQAIQVGEKIFYLTPDGRRVQSMSYEWQENNWISQDLTYASEHITLSGGEHRAWIQHPAALYALTLENGDIALLTYDRTAQTVGWTVYTYEGFHVIDIGTGTINGVSRVVLVGQRTTGKIDVEISGDIPIYMDSYVTEFFDPQQQVLTGLDHLEGSVVQVVSDGAVDLPKVVIGGQITASRLSSRISAGIQVHSKIVTLPPDVPQTQIRSWKKRWNKVWALMYESTMPIINGTRPPDRTPSTPMDTPELGQTTHYKVANLGWDDFGQITIEEDQPVAMNVLAIYGEMGAETIK